MNLILVRHADAAFPAGAVATSDFDRPLTPLGLRQAEAMARAFQQLKRTPDVIWTSPFVRARQTAEILGSSFGVAIEECDLLACDNLRPRKLSERMTEVTKNTLLLVGHMPDIGRYAAWLTGADDGSMPFEKAGAAGFASDVPVEKARAILSWFAPPEFWAEVTSP